MQTATDQQRFCGREFTAQEVSLIQEVVETCAGISRLELAHTVCELLEWKRPGGGLKARECRDLLERLESQGVLTLPGKKSCGSSNARKLIAPAEEGQVHSQLTGSVEEFAPLDVELVESRQQRQLFRELLSRYHYLGYAMPYGARLQYLVYVNRPRARSGRVRAVFQPCLADEGSRSMDRLGRCGPQAATAAHRQQQSPAGGSAHPQPGQHGAVSCS